jgi:hypothetical protein
MGGETCCPAGEGGGGVIVLDEHLLGLSIDRAIARWYAGKVGYITELRPNTVIKDEAIPSLLREATQPTFVTCDVAGFWRKITPHRRYCIVCFAISEERWRCIPTLLRRLFRTEGFRTKRERMGKVALVTATTVRFYAVHQPSISELPLAG